MAAQLDHRSLMADALNEAPSSSYSSRPSSTPSLSQKSSISSLSSVASASYVTGRDLPDLPFDRVWDYFKHIVSLAPSNIALISTHQPADILGVQSQALDTDEYAAKPYLRWTFKQLETAAAQLAARLSARGVGPGTPIFTFLPNCAEFITLYWASFALGAVMIPLSPANLAHEQEILHKINTALVQCPDSGAVVVAADYNIANQLAVYEPLLDALKIVIKPQTDGELESESAMTADAPVAVDVAAAAGAPEVSNPDQARAVVADAPQGVHESNVKPAIMAKPLLPEVSPASAPIAAPTPVDTDVFVNTPEIVVLDPKSPAPADAITANSENGRAASGADQVTPAKPASDKNAVASQWTSLDDLFDGSATFTTPPITRAQNGDDFDQQRAKKPCGVIIFTSGTTALPKGCFHPESHLLEWPRIDLADANMDGCLARSGDVESIATPNSHLLAFATIAKSHLGGTSVMHAGEAFNAQTFLRYARAEKCTHASMVPTMVYALRQAQDDAGVRFETFKSLTVSGASVSPEVLSICLNDLGSRSVVNTYGSTEGAYLRSDRTHNPSDIIDDGTVSSGRGITGCRMKVCEPETTIAVHRGEPGELHLSSGIMVDRYIGMDTPEFYTDAQGVQWYKTGDQAVIKEDGRLFLVGRIKELIIRGGVNIAPPAMESVINRSLPQLADLTVQIIGAPDRFAGEVPVAVTAQPADDATKKLIKDTIFSEMGKKYALADVVAIQDLGFDKFPTTSLGKVQKTNVQKALKKYVEEQARAQEEEEKAAADPGAAQMVDQVKRIISQSAIVSINDLKPETAIADIGDSITLMRVQDRLKKLASVEISVQEILEAETLGGLIESLKKRKVDAAAAAAAAAEAAASGPSWPAAVCDHPPTMDEMAHVQDDPEVFEATKTVINRALAKVDLDWSAVRDVMPAYDFEDINARSNTGALKRWTAKTLYLMPNKSPAEVRAALKRTLANNPMLGSFIVWDDDLLGKELALHVTVDSSDSFLDRMIHDGGRLATVADMRARASVRRLMIPPLEYPGPLFQAFIYWIEETNCTGLILNPHHAVADATVSGLMLEDFDTALNETGNDNHAKTELRPHIPYKIWCDNYHSLRLSPAAQTATKFHVKRLQGLADHASRMWPALPTGPPGPWDQEVPSYDSFHEFSSAPIQALCARETSSELVPAIVLKAALALAVMQHKAASSMVLSQTESGRTGSGLTFLPPAVAAQMDPPIAPTDIGGQLLQLLLNIVRIEPGESTLGFLRRIQADQRLETKYADAPWRSVMAGLDPESAALFPTLALQCRFNWMGPLPSPESLEDGAAGLFRHFNMLGVVGQDVSPFTLHGSLLRGGPRGEMVSLWLQSTALSTAELEDVGRKLENTVAWLTATENANRPVEDFRNAVA